MTSKSNKVQLCTTLIVKHANDKQIKTKYNCVLKCKENINPVLLAILYPIGHRICDCIQLLPNISSQLEQCCFAFAAMTLFSFLSLRNKSQSATNYQE
jgi:hypothetical protein